VAAAEATDEGEADSAESDADAV
jgi:hypothetical protein